MGFSSKKGISVSSGFKFQAEAPIDARYQVDNITDRNELVTIHAAYAGLRVFVKSEAQSYEYTGSAWVKCMTGDHYVHPSTHPATMITQDATHRFMTDTERTKLNGIETGANKYVHPSTHAISMITETTDKKVMTAAERTKLAGIATGANNYTHPATHALSMITETDDFKVMTAAERTKLSGIANNANNYTHPASHAATMITEDATHRFFTDTERTKLNGIATGANKYVHPASHSIDIITETDTLKIMTSDERTKLAGVATNANNYVHPSTHAATMITQDATHRFMTDTERTKLNGIAENANNYTHPSTHAISMITETTDKKIMTAAERTKLAGVATNANNYVHPSTHAATMITQDATHRFITDTERSRFIKVWSTTVKCATWSRLCYVPYNTNVIGSNYIINISGSRASVVYNYTFMVTAHHSSQSSIVKLSGSTYGSPVQVRIVSDQAGNSYFEIYDNARGATNSTTQSVKCTMVPIFTGSVTTYSTFTDGTTLPTNFTVTTNLIVSEAGQLQGNLVGNASTATKATQDSAGQQINTTYIKSLSNSGSVITWTKGNGTTGTMTIPNTTYGVVTTSANGLMSKEDKVKLNGIATGANAYTHPSTHAISMITETTDKKIMTAAERTKLAGIATGANAYTHPTSSGNKHIPSGGSSGQILRWSSDGTAVWGSDNNTTYGVFKGATGSAAGGTGLVPAPAAGKQGQFLRGDGTWDTPANTTYGVATQSANGLMSSADKVKLDGVATGANKYVHPSTHAATMITEDASHRFMTDTERTKLAGIATGANNYSHPTGAGNNHIPSGGSSGQILRWSSSGVAIWGADNNTTYSTGTSSTLGLTKLYGGTGSATDGTMTQVAITNALNGKSPTTHTHSYGQITSVNGNTISRIPGTSRNGNIFAYERGVYNTTRANRLAFLPVNGIIIERSTNSGSTWADAGLSDTTKKKLVDERRSSVIPLTVTTPVATTHQMRITFTPVDRYTSVDQIYIWFSKNGNHVVKVDVERSTIGAKTTFTKIATDVEISGWAGNNIINIPYGTFGGGTTQNSNHYSYRLIFKITTVDTSDTYKNSSPNIYDIRFYGDNVWNYGNNYMYNDHMYSWDSSQNVTFPATITATGFVGNASTATKATQDSAGQQINTTYIKSLSNSGSVITYTKGNGSTGTMTIPNTTYGVATTSANGLMSSADKTKLDGVATGANKYVHPTGNGNNHIPSGGSSGQILRWSSAGVAVWGNDNNTTYSVFGAATASAAGSNGLVPAPAAGKQGQYLRGDGTWSTPTNTTYGVATTSANGLMSSADKTKLDGIATGANKYVHPTGAGNNHIPAGGSSGQILRWSSAGVAVWGADNNTTYSTGTASTLGLTKLYTATGSATDGTMTQAAITSALNGKAASSHGTHVPSVCTTITDWNSATTNGWYMASGATNQPSGSTSTWWLGRVIAHNANYLVQELYQFTASSDAYAVPKYMRMRTNSTWGTWRNVTVGTAVPLNAKFTDTVYTHPTSSGNKHIPSGGSSGQILRWSSDGTAVWGSDNNTTYGVATTSANGLMSKEDKVKLNGIATGANNYTHPTGAGNNHIPSGGSSGQILRWSSSGVAVWGSDNNTTYSTGTASALGLTKLYTGTGSATDGTMTQAAITTQLNAKTPKSVKNGVILSAASWTGSAAPYTITITVTGATASNNIEIILYGSATDAQVQAWMEAAVVNGTQTTNSVTLKAYGEKPGIDIPIETIVRADI